MSHRPKGSIYRCFRRGKALLIQYVCLKSAGVPARGTDFGGDRLGRVKLNIQQGNAVAFFGKPFGKTAAQHASRTCNNYGFF